MSSIYTQEAYYPALVRLHNLHTKLGKEVASRKGLDRVVYDHKSPTGWSDAEERNGILGKPSGAVVTLVEINLLTLDLAEKLGLPIKEANTALRNYKEKTK